MFKICGRDVDGKFKRPRQAFPSRELDGATHPNYDQKGQVVGIMTASPQSLESLALSKVSIRLSAPLPGAEGGQTISSKVICVAITKDPPT
jgi:hypothetical protein